MSSAWHSCQLQTRISSCLKDLVNRDINIGTSKFIMSNLADLLPTFLFLIPLDDIITTQLCGPASFSSSYSSYHVALQQVTTRIILGNRSLWASLSSLTELMIATTWSHREDEEKLYITSYIVPVLQQTLSLCLFLPFPFSFPSSPPPPDRELPEDRVCIHEE